MTSARAARRGGFLVLALVMASAFSVSSAQAGSMNRTELGVCAQKSMDPSVGKADLSTAQFAVGEAQEAHYVALEAVSDAEFAISMARKRKDKKAAEEAFALADANERAARADLETANARQMEMSGRLNAIANSFNAQCTGKGANTADVAAVCRQDRYAYSDFCLALK